MRIASLLIWATMVLCAAACATFGVLYSWIWFFGLLLSLALVLLGLWDLTQERHSILRNYPLLGHIRFLCESIRPEIMQYFVEGDEEGQPYSRTRRTAVYERAKGIEEIKPFGTDLDVYGTEYEFINHSIAPKPKQDDH